MKILMALSQLEVTGAEVYAVTLGDELIRRGNEVFFVSDTLTKETKGKYFKIEFNKRGIIQRYRQVKALINIIKENDIQVIHAHSRASSWSCAIAAKIMNIPLITTVHGKQPVHLSRRVFKAFGEKIIAVSENIKEQIVSELGVKEKFVNILRNPIDTKIYNFETGDGLNKNKVISIIGRLSGPKGDVAYDVLEILSKLDNVLIQVIGGSEIPEKFKRFENNNKIKFLGYIDDVPIKIQNSDLIIGAGRVGVEAILSGKPLIAVGEAKYIGVISENNLEDGIKSNFGDISYEKIAKIESKILFKDIMKALTIKKDTLSELRKIIVNEYDLSVITNKIEKIYQEEYVKKRHYEIPILMYHRVIEDKKESGVHGIYVTTKMFEKHLSYLKRNNYEVVTFKDLTNNNYKKRFDKGKKQIILTFDDGYVDNYKYAFPLLKKYGFKCIIYLVSHLSYNRWDVDNKENPEKRFELMDIKMIKEMQEYGIEFGGHTKNHPRLPLLNENLVKEEIFDSKKELEDKLGEKLVSFAYPYGDLDEYSCKIVEEAGYEFAVATDSGDICFSSDLYKIRRIGIFSTNSFLTFKRKVSGKYNFLKIKREKKENKNYK